MITHRFASISFLACIAVWSYFQGTQLHAQGTPYPGSSPDIIWSAADPGSGGLGGMAPTGGAGPSANAWSFSPHGWCFNGPTGFECETCNEGGIPTPYPTEHGIATGCAGCKGYNNVGGGGTTGWLASVYGAVGTGVPYVSNMVSYGSSLIDNLRFNYIHWGDDYLPGVTGGAYLRRFLRTRNAWIPSSLGPDGFLNVDLKVRFQDDFIWDEADIRQNELFASATVFDPALFEEIRLMRISVSKLLPVQRSKIRDMLLYDDQMQLVTSTSLAWGGAKYAKLTTLSGVEYLFEIVTASSDPTSYNLYGRYVQYKEPRGITHTITYKTWTTAEIAASPSRQWQINQVVDSFNRTMTFDYFATQLGGRWCVSSITLPDATEVTYTYAGNYLQSVSHADGTTTSITYAAAANAPGDIGIISIFDPVAELGHRKKTVAVSGSVQWSNGSYVPVSFDHVREISNGSGEVTYLNFLSNVDGYNLVHVYEGGGRMKRILNYNHQVAYLSDGWSVANSYEVTGTTENEYQENTVDFYRTAAFRDDTGVETEYKYDDASRRVYVVYGDDTFESFCFGQNMNVTRYRDRKGNVTKSTYDANGNKLSEQVGLTDHPSNSGSTLDPVTRVPIYDRCATNDVQTSEYGQSTWQYDSLGRMTVKFDSSNNRTDYTYDTLGRLISITEPSDVVNGPRAVTSYTYDSTGHKLTETNPLGEVTQFFYTAIGKILKTQYPDGSTEETIYGTSGNAIGLPIKIIDRTGVVTTFEYDAAERLTTKVNAYAVMQGVTEVLTRTVATTETWVYLNGTHDPIEYTRAGSKTKYVYDYRGRPVQTKVYPRNNTELVSASAYLDNRLVSQADPYGRKTYHGYDLTNGRLIRTIRGMVPSYTLSNFAQVMAVLRDQSPNAPFVINDSVFNAAGQLESAFDPRGIATSFEYDSRNRQTNRRAAYGTASEARTETLYDTDGRVSEVRSPRYFDSTDTNGYQKAREQWTYNGRGRVATHTEAAGTAESATESFTYDLKGRTATRTDFGSNVWTSTYVDCCDKQSATVDPLGHGTISNRDSRGQVVHTIQVSDVSTHVANFANPIDAKTLSETTTKYDGLGRPIYQTTWLVPRGLVDPANPPIAGVGGVALADGLTTQYLYDNDLTDGVGLDSSAGVSALKLGTGGSGSTDVSLAAAIAKLAAAQASGGAEITFSGASPGRATVTINSEDELSFSISDSAGRSVMSGKLNNYRGSGATAANTLASWSCQLHDETTTLSGYGTLLVTKSIDALGNATKTWTDGAGRTIRSFDQLDKATAVTYDAGGNQLSVRDPNNVGADMLYDALGRNTQRTDTFGDVTKTDYDKAGNAVKQTDAKNKFTLISFDARGRRKSTTDRISAGTTFSYTALGQLASLTDAESQATAYTYDARGSKLTEQYPDHVANSSVGTTGYGIVTFVYDNAGRVQRKQDQVGDTCTCNYDLAGRMTSRNYRTLTNSPSGTIADTDTFTFDRAGRMLIAVSGRYSNTVTYTFDPIGRKASEALTISSQTYTIGYDYNSRNELIKYTLPDSSISERTYHATGALNQLKLDSSTVSTRTYDDGRRLTSDALGNGITESRTYRNDNLLSTISYSGASIGDLTYTWDANKNKTGEAISGTMSGYGFASSGTTYDFEDRLTAHARTSSTFSQSWSLTSVGDWSSVTTNGTAQSRTHGNTHELLTAGGSNVTTDVKGNITVLPSNLVTQSSALGLVYDFENKMKSADVGNNSSVDVEYKYDALGRRVGRSGSSGSFAYVQSDQQTLVDYGLGDAPSSPLYRYVYGSYIDEPVVRKGSGSGGTLYYFHRNQQYSVYCITSSSAAITERYAYTAYGEPTICNSSGTVIGSSSISNRYAYTGREWDGTVGLYHFRARWMSGLSGRFLSRDPIGYEGSEWNLFESCKARPLHFLDPNGQTGLNPISITQVYLRDGPGGPTGGWPPGRFAPWPMPINRCFLGIGATNGGGPRTWEDVFGDDCTPVFYLEDQKCGQHENNCMKECDKIMWPYFGYSACKSECQRAGKCCRLTENKIISDCLATAKSKGIDPSKPNDKDKHKQLKCKNTYGGPIPVIPNGPYNSSLF